MQIISNFIEEQNLSSEFRLNCEDYWTPLASQLQNMLKTKKIREYKKPFVFGINGCQGSGKSTLAKFLKTSLQSIGLNTAILSLDDFYLSPEARQDLAERVHPLFKTRGVPGTHDTGLALRKFDEIFDVTKTSVLLPRFDKTLDAPAPKNLWPIATRPLDLIIFEGWFVGAKSQPDDDLIMPVNTFERTEDPEAVWRTHANKLLAQDYQVLFSKIDKLIMLRAPNFESVFTWRNNQEDDLKRIEMASNRQMKRSMTETEVLRFIQHFQRLTLHCLKTIPSQADMIFDLDQTQRVVTESGRLSLD